MEILATQFSKYGMTYDQIFRSGRSAVYKLTKKSMPFERFEVVRVMSRRGAITPSGKIVEPKEGYPKGGEWGLYGFTCQTREAAKVRLAKMLPLWNSEPDQEVEGTDED